MKILKHISWQRFILGMLLFTSLNAPLLLASCFAPDKVSGSLVRIYANESMGTGFIMDKAGYVVTSYHVVAGSKSISVVMKSGEQYVGKLICRDEAKDFAMIRLNGVSGELPALSMGDSETLKEGDQVTIAGYQQEKSLPELTPCTVTAQKKVEGVSCLQLGPVVTVGRYGSPVINKVGEVAGMVTWDYGDATRVGLAVAINEFKDLASTAVCTDCGELAISALSLKSVADTSAIIIWQTRKPATGIVEYGPAGSYSNKTGAIAGLNRSHAVVMTGLKPKTAYQYRVISLDSCGNEVFSDGQNLMTEAAGPQSGSLTIINVAVSEISSSGATVTWVTNKPANSVISYGTTEASKSNTRTDSNNVYEHKIRFEGLTPEVRYYLDVQSVSEKGEVAQGSAKSFKTASTAPVCCKLACKMPDFVFKDVSGKEFTQDDMAGKKICMTFTKTTCSICMGQAVYMNDIYQTWLKGDIMFFCVANREKPEDIVNWIKKYGLTMPVYHDVDGELVNYCHLRTIPCTICINEKGVICLNKEGPFGSKKEFEETLKNIKWQ
jgi:S1-C subfamily serine protease/peroxiredoxin